MSFLIFFLLLLSAPSFSAPQKKEDASHWKEFTMEAYSQLGEFLFQEKSYEPAKNVYQESLHTSTQLLEPTQSWVALDLYRVAQLDAQQGRLQDAEKHLDILIHRYPSSQWIPPAKELLNLIRKKVGTEEGKKVPTQNMPLEDESFLILQHLWLTVMQSQWAEALQLSNQFLEKYFQHPASQEVRLLQATLLWKQGQSDSAQKILEGLWEQSKNSEFRNKILYLLGGLFWEKGAF
ncbi:MAG: tetratricopeptide repeat protein, partial [Elusimicrobia bacterium]|nr:tetratricopeptide repeat protein [Elusimicrobiota bacterium]